MSKNDKEFMTLKLTHKQALAVMYLLMQAEYGGEPFKDFDGYAYDMGARDFEPDKHAERVYKDMVKEYHSIWEQAEVE